MSEMIGELTEGLQALGIHPEPKRGETTAQMVLRLIRAQMSAVERFREEVAETRLTLKATKEQLARFTGPRQRGEGGRFLKAVEAA